LETSCNPPMLLPDGTEELWYSYRNELSTGYDMVLSNPFEGHVDIQIFQVIMNVVPSVPDVSLSLPESAATYFLSALQGAVNNCRNR
jgi:hypothetical protein